MKPTVADIEAWPRRQRVAHINGCHKWGAGTGPCSRRDRGLAFRRMLGQVILNGVEYSFHATKGRRERKLCLATPKLLLPAPLPGGGRAGSTRRAAAWAAKPPSNGARECARRSSRSIRLEVREALAITEFLTRGAAE